ncbi:MAG: hypothetical protein H7Z43_09265, partial [Clostridia bacterium]|nr:hypothetical protein [Deltaproteobacteria bacterium]
MEKSNKRFLSLSVSDVMDRVILPVAQSIDYEVARDRRCLWDEVIEHRASDGHYLALLDNRTHDAVIHATLPVPPTNSHRTAWRHLP